ncbi:MAG: ATP-binding protein [Hyphomonas sp.]
MFKRVFPKSGSAEASAGATDRDYAPDVVGRKVLPPDPRIVEGLGRNHSFETAIADLVDNSVDAGARNILVRFVRNETGPVGVYIVDDGRGMNETEIDLAMTLGGRREYGASDLGHFGVGLKASSLGQAKSLSVVSKMKGHAPVGRRLNVERISDAFECEVLSDTFAAGLLNRSWGHFEMATGTAVIWSEVRSFPSILQGGDAEAFLGETVERLARHLGLIFHRFLKTGDLCITIDQEDAESGAVGVPFPVQAVDPFAYAGSGENVYPRTLTAECDGKSLALACHIWPGRSNRANFKLLGGAGTDFQGFFVYRNDRLIQPGGWNGLVQAKPELQLARVAVDISADGNAFFEMNPEKTQVSPTDLFRRSLHSVGDGDIDFSKFLDHAADAYRESRKRVRLRPHVLAPGPGIAPGVKSALGEEYEFIKGVDAIEIRWDDLDDETFFEVKKQGHLVRLNRRYRPLLTRGERGSLNDAPVIKALLYLLIEGTMRGDYFGPRDRDNLLIWQAVLTAAAESEK